MYILKTRWENPDKKFIWDQHLEIDPWMLYNITYYVCCVRRSEDATGHGKEKKMKVKVKVRQKKRPYSLQRGHIKWEKTRTLSELSTAGQA